MSNLQSERIIIPMPRALVEQIDTHRFAGRYPSRAEAIRSLLAGSLTEAAGKATDALQAPAQTNPKPGTESAVTASLAPNQTLRDLLAGFFAESTEHLTEFGYEAKTSAEEALANELIMPSKNEPFDPDFVAFIPATAARQLEMIEGFNGPAAVALREMLMRLCASPSATRATA